MSKTQLFYALSILVPFCARAQPGPVQNGPVQISQAGLLAASPYYNGFPYTITKPGSYQLTSNLTVPAGVNGIVIAASNVVLDLNGFNITLLGPEPGGSFSAISAVGSPSMISVRNGSITVPDGFNSGGVSLFTSTGVILQDLMMSGSDPIIVGSNSLVKNNIATGEFFVSCPSVIVENTAGIILRAIPAGGADCVVYNNRASNFTAPVIQ